MAYIEKNVVKRMISVCWVVICYASDIIEYDRRRSELSNASLQMTLDANSIEKFKGRLTCDWPQSPLVGLVRGHAAEPVAVGAVIGANTAAPAVRLCWNISNTLATKLGVIT